MILPSDDAALFFDLIFKLQLYVNQKLGIIEDITSKEEFVLLPLEEKLEVRDRLWSDTRIIDEYIKDNPDQLPREHLQIVRSWKQAVVGDFYLERMGKRQAIFILGNDVYGVLGLTDEIDEIFHPTMLPLRVRTVLLPFKGQVVYDGLIQSYRIRFGGGIKGQLKETYMAAKQNRRIITSMDAKGQAGESDNETVLPDHMPTIAELQKLARKLRSTKDAPAVWSPSFKLAQAALALAEAAIANPDDLDTLWDRRNAVVKRTKGFDTVLNRAER